MTQEEQQVLIDRVKAGDAAAFRQLLDAHYAIIWRMAYRFCGNQHDAEDVTQMVCMKLASAIQGFKGKSAFTTWLYRVVLNAARDWQRSQKRHQSGHIGIDHAAEVASAAPSPEQALHSQQKMAQIHALPAAEREVIFLVFGEGLSHREAAEVLGCAESTVSWRIHEARKKLKNEGGPDHG